MPTGCRVCGKPLTLIQDIFNRTVHDRCRKTYGYIGGYGLTEWWFSTFTEEERQYIEFAFQPMGISISVGRQDADQDSLLTGSRGLQISGRAGSFLANLAEWLNKPECRHLAHRVIEKAEAVATDVLEKHDVYQVAIVINYRDREKGPQFLRTAVALCEKQIRLGPQAIKAWNERRRHLRGRQGLHQLPTHKGFEQLAIIHEKAGNFLEAIRLAREAKRQGWEGGDWEGRIARCERRLSKQQGN